MKHIKRLLCAALCLAMLLGMGVFARADEAADPYAPIITKQPTGRPSGLNVLVVSKKTSLISLSVEARSPYDSGGKLSYAWFEAGNPEESIGTDASIEIPVSVNDFSKLAVKEYYVVVTNTYIDAEENEKTAFVKSDEASYILFASLGNMLSSVWSGPIFTTILFSPLKLISSLLFIISIPFLSPLQRLLDWLFGLIERLLNYLP